MATSFVKWAGGKSRLVPTIASGLRRVPARYFEPFTGGGAVFFGLESRGLIRDATLNDLNPVLSEAFEVVRDAVEELIQSLAPLAADYISKDEPGRSELYYRMRAATPTQPVERSARLIFLNRTCFNGLFRVNRRGEFNVPHGTYAKPRILDATGLREASRALRAVKVRRVDFEKLCDEATVGDFVYLDPPYQPLSATANFTSYTGKSFDESDQRRLARSVESMVRRGADVMVSNSAHPFIEGLYDGMHVRRVKMPRAINSAGNGRAPIDELLITNWDSTTVSHRGEYSAAAV